MTNDDNASLYNAYTSMFSDSLAILRESINDSFAPLLASLFMQKTIDILSDNVGQLAFSLAHSVLENIDCNILSNACHQLIADLVSITLPTYDFSSLVDSSTLNKDYVSLSDDAVKALTNFFNEQEEPVPKISSQMSVKEFLLAVLLPLVCMILPMMQNSYYHHLDSIEAQKAQLQEAEYQEAIMNLEALHAEELEELNSNITELLQYLKSAQDTDFPDEEDIQSLPTVLKVPPDSLSAEDEVADEAGNHGANQSQH